MLLGRRRLSEVLRSGRGVEPTSSSAAPPTENGSALVGGQCSFSPGVHPTASVDPLAIVADGATVGAGTIVLPFVYIAPGVCIGKGCFIGAGSVIGQAGFGYTWRDDEYFWERKPHPFGVVLEDDVSVGANTCIDRGSWRDTYISEGTKIDNLVHIAHNVRTGKNCIIIAGAMLAGSVWLGDNVWVGPHACVNQRLRVHDNAFIGTGAVVTKNVPSDVVVAGVPARVLRNREATDA